MRRRYITLKSDGKFVKTKKYLMNVKTEANMDDVRMIMSQCIARLKRVTPKDTGLTANSWEYSIRDTDGGLHVEIHNTNIQNGVNIALILEYGHATSNGTWIEGERYISPTVTKYYKKILDDTWERITSL